MDPALVIAAFAACFSAASAFIGYWAGVGRTERAWRSREAALLDDLDDAVVLLHAATNVRVLRPLAEEA